MLAANSVSSKPFHALVDVSSKPKPPLINHRTIKKETGQATGNQLPTLGGNCRPIKTPVAATKIIAKSQSRDVISTGRKTTAATATTRANNTARLQRRLFF